MRVFFFGTADFGLPTLQAISSHPRHDLLGVVTGPNKPHGRGRGMAATPIGQWAASHGVTPLFKPASLSDPEFVTALRAVEADAYVVVAFRILPEAVFSIPRFAFNLHASLLPAYRGAAPIQRAIMAGERTTGVTTFMLKKSVDTGDIIGQRTMPISDSDDFATVYGRLSELGATLVIETLDALDAGRVLLMPQDPAQASKAPKITGADLVLRFDRSSVDVKNHVRALSPKPGVAVGFRNSTLKIFTLDAVPDASLHPVGSPGEIVGLDSAVGPIVATADGAVALSRVQPSGKSVQTGADFIRGYRPQVGERFTTKMPKDL